MLDSCTEGPGFKSQPRRCWVTVLGKLFTPYVPLFTKLVAALLSVAGVTAGLAESNGSIPPGLWLTLPAGWLPRTEISSGTLRSAVEYGLPLPFYCTFGATEYAVISYLAKNPLWFLLFFSPIWSGEISSIEFNDFVHVVPSSAAEMCIAYCSSCCSSFLRVSATLPRVSNFIIFTRLHEISRTECS